MHIPTTAGTPPVLVPPTKANVLAAGGPSGNTSINATSSVPPPAVYTIPPSPAAQSSASSLPSDASPRKQHPHLQAQYHTQLSHQQQQQQQQQHHALHHHQQGYQGSGTRGFVDLLRSLGHLTLNNASEIREELRHLRRRRGKQEEAVMLSELAALASCLNELVMSMVTSSSSNSSGPGGSGSGSTEEGGGEGDSSSKAGGGAVAVEPSRRALAGLFSYEGLMPPIPHPAVPAPSTALGDAALLHYCFDFLVEGRLQYRKQLGELALVCRQWRDLAQADRFWKPVVLQLFPRLSPALADHDEEDGASGPDPDAAALTEAAVDGAGAGASSEPSTSPGGRAGWHRKYLIQFGRCLFDRPIRQGPWHEGITLSFDLHDEQDGTRLFSSTGPIRFTGTTIPGITAMKLTGRRRRVTAPFSAASRDRGLGNLSSIEELFQEGDSRDYPVSFTIRVTARDERTGKMALLFSSAKRTKRWVEPLGEDMGVPQGTLLVNQGWSRVTIPSTDLAMQMLTVFYVAPVEGQPETISAAERLYSVLTLDCAFMLQCKTEDQEQIGRFILAALENGPGVERDG